jgi:hypothetical protein
MLVNISDKTKEILIAKTLGANQELDQEDCVTTWDLGVRFVVVYILRKKLVMLVPNLLYSVIIQK